MPDEMTMIERVAKAIYATWAKETGITEAWEDVVRVGHSIVPLATKEAKAAIEEMRTPTGGMEDWFRDNLEHTETGAWVWKGAIDAALKEHEGEKG
jgi:hypothetical protein